MAKPGVKTRPWLNDCFTMKTNEIRCGALIYNSRKTDLKETFALTYSVFVFADLDRNRPVLPICATSMTQVFPTTPATKNFDFKAPRTR